MNQTSSEEGGRGREGGRCEWREGMEWREGREGRGEGVEGGVCGELLPHVPSADCV